MARVKTFALDLNLNFLVRSRNHSIVSTPIPLNFLAKNRKNQNVNFGEATPLSWTRDSTPISQSNLRFVNKVGGPACACVSPSPLPALPDSVRHLLRFPLRRSRLLSSWLPLMMSQNDGPNIPQESAKTVKCVIKGRVQGVFYRNWTIENATQLGLKGWVRNRRDGSVEALFSGNPDSVEEMQRRCRRGPPDAMVTGFQALPCDEDPGTGFHRKPTV